MKQEMCLLKRKVFLAAVFVSAALTGCGSGESQKNPEINIPSPPEVDVITITRSSAVLTQDLPGRTQAFRTAQVRARVEGLVEKRIFTEGSNVEKGDLLYQIFARNYQTAYDAAKVERSIARQALARYKYLFGLKAVSQQEFELAEARFKQAEAVFSKAREDLDNTRVPAPISGRIGRSQITEGALVGREEATLLAIIEQIDPLYVNFTQSGADLFRLQQSINEGKLGRTGFKRVELVLEDGSIYRLPGTFLFSDLAVDPGTNSVSLRALFPNPKQELLPGMFVRVRFPEAKLENAIKIPQRSLLLDAQGQYVMVVDSQNKVAVQRVKAGSMAGGDFIIVEGLSGGEKVIVNGVQKARPGAMVKPVTIKQGAIEVSSIALPTSRAVK